MTDMMDSSHEVTRAHHALSAPAAFLDRHLLRAVHTGLLLVPSELPATTAVSRQRDGQDRLELQPGPAPGRERGAGRTVAASARAGGPE